MSKILSELFYGTLRPIETLTNPQLAHLEKLTTQNLGRLQAQIDEKLKDLLAAYSDSETEHAQVISEQAFVDGFALGVKIMVEALTSAEKQMPEIF